MTASCARQKSWRHSRLSSGLIVASCNPPLRFDLPHIRRLGLAGPDLLACSTPILSFWVFALRVLRSSLRLACRWNGVVWRYKRSHGDNPHPRLLHHSAMRFSLTLSFFTLFAITVGRNIPPTFQPSLHLILPSPQHPQKARSYPPGHRSRGGEILVNIRSRPPGSLELRSVLVSMPSWPGAVS